jgi:hypothetical protein
VSDSSTISLSQSGITRPRARMLCRYACGSPLDLWNGPGGIRRGFLAFMQQDPVPAVGREILSGAWMPDGTFHGGAPSLAPIVPTPTPPPPPKPVPASAPAVAKLSPKKIAAAIAKAKAAIAKGAKREAVLKRLRSAGIETSEI